MLPHANDNFNRPLGRLLMKAAASLVFWGLAVWFGGKL
jgi:hypothetical protein